MVDEHLLDEGLHPADARPEGDADPRRELRCDLEAGRFEGLSGRGDREVHEAVGTTDLLAVHVVLRIEVADLAGDGRLEARRVKTGDRTDPALASQDAVPGLFHRRTEGGDHAETGHHDTAALAVLHGFESSERVFLERLKSRDL